VQNRTWVGKVFIGVSVDGFIARPDGDIEWLTSRGELAGDTGYEAFMSGVSCIVMGKGTYETTLGFDGWPHQDRRVVVLSRTLETDDLRVEVVRSLADLAEALAHATGGVYVDGGQTIQALLREGWIDEVTISRVPVLIGEGKALFGSLAADVSLELIENLTLGAGLTQTRYRVVH
jgi:dihydrofolate reductase